eukprot:TRINITY_DN1148_c0_g2_i1.p1 TRINITY_DN1148_c0_g2~~TRINITY_DN1148_c0_g2_i1.p1  ORF type:complete len:115 (+),score=15.89 TRINITY_DN1148_c0_g2_i1:162-506(+)
MSWFQRLSGPDDPQEEQPADYYDWSPLSENPYFPTHFLEKAFANGEKEFFIDQNRKIDLTEMVLIKRSAPSSLGGYTRGREIEKHYVARVTDALDPRMVYLANERADIQLGDEN